MTAISLDAVSKRFGDIEAVKGVDVDIEDGEFITIVGPSGCGKTTTLRTIAGLEEASDGTITFGDRDVTKQPPSTRNVGMVFQNLALYPHMSVRENMTFGLNIAGVPKSERAERVEEAARMLDISELLDRKPADLSGGQQQRVAIGRTIVLDPDVFLLDEPLASLDAKLRVEIREELQELQQRVGVTTVYVTHDQEQAMTMSDRIVVMNEGEVQQFASPEEVYSDPNNEFVAHFIGTPSMNFFDGTLRTRDGQAVVDVGFHEVAIDGDHAADADESLDGGDVRLGVRPEHVELLDDPDDGFRATVKFVEPTGKESIVHMTTGDLDFTVIVPGSVDVADGSTYGVDFEAGRRHVFDAVSGDRVL